VSERIIAVGLLLAISLTILAVAAVVHEAAWLPGIDPRASFNEYGTSGPPLVVHGMTAFAAAVLFGALIGRQLPALIVSAVLALVLVTGIGFAFPYGAPTQWVSNDATTPPTQPPTPPGAPLTARSSPTRRPSALAPVPSNSYNWIAERYEEVVRVLSGGQRPEVEMRESVAPGTITVLLLVGTFLVIERRRPY